MKTEAGNGAHAAQESTERKKTGEERKGVVLADGRGVRTVRYGMRMREPGA